MQEEGKLLRLKTKWWVEKNTGAGEGNCDSGGAGGGDTPELGLDNVGGVFLVLGAGLLVGISVGILDFLWNIRSVAIEEKVILHQYLWEFIWVQSIESIFIPDYTKRSIAP